MKKISALLALAVAGMMSLSVCAAEGEKKAEGGKAPKAAPVEVVGTLSVGKDAKGNAEYKITAADGKVYVVKAGEATAKDLEAKNGQQVTLKGVTMEKDGVQVLRVAGEKKAKGEGKK